MILMVIDIFQRIRAQKRMLYPQSVSNHRYQRDKRIHNHMLLLMMSSIILFLVTTFPLTIHQLVSVHVVRDVPSIENLLVSMTIMNWIQSNNAAVSDKL